MRMTDGTDNPSGARRARRPSSVSQALRRISDAIVNPEERWLIGGENEQPAFRIGVASDRSARERAYRLARNVYLQCEYASSETPLIASIHDADPQTLTLLAETDDGRDAATVTLVFDSPAGLPCDEIYRDELDRLRAQGRRLVEVTRLAIGDEFKHSRMLLVRLFNFIYLFARRVKGFDDFVIEVNPRHVDYYRRLLFFDVIGSERPCPRVNGAPAVLLRLDLAIGDREVRRVGGHGAAADERTLYPHFYSWLEDGAVSEFLARRHRPMTADDAQYFRIDLDARVPATHSAVRVAVASRA